MNRLIAIFFLCALLGGCAARVPLTRSLLDEYHVPQSELTDLQYYLSGRIDLSRRYEKPEIRKKSRDRLLRKSKLKEKKVTVSDHTPGIAVNADFNAIDISFARGSSFRFICDPADPDSRYALTPDKRRTLAEHKNDPVQTGLNIFHYKGCDFYSPQDGGVYLDVKKRDLEKYRVSSRRLRGRRIWWK